MSDKNTTDKSTDNNKTNNNNTSSKSKPYKTTFSETYVEPVGMGPIKEK